MHSSIQVARNKIDYLVLHNYLECILSHTPKAKVAYTIGQDVILQILVRKQKIGVRLS
jgi:hypothetical protein